MHLLKRPRGLSRLAGTLAVLVLTVVVPACSKNTPTQAIRETGATVEPPPPPDMSTVPPEHRQMLENAKMPEFGMSDG